MLPSCLAASWLDPSSRGPFVETESISSQMAALKERAAEVTRHSDGRPESLMGVLAGTERVLQEGQQIAQRLARAGGASVLSSEIGMVETVLQRIRSAMPVGTCMAHTSPNARMMSSPRGVTGGDGLRGAHARPVVEATAARRSHARPGQAR